jgi:thiamine monophosphate synthase
MNIEVAVPDEWTPGQALAMRQLLQHALKTGIPVISIIRKDASADQLKEIYDRVEALIKEAGLQVE